MSFLVRLDMIVQHVVSWDDVLVVIDPIELTFDHGLILICLLLWAHRCYKLLKLLGAGHLLHLPLFLVLTNMVLRWVLIRALISIQLLVV